MLLLYHDPISVVSSHVLEVLSYLSLLSHFRLAKLYTELGLRTGMENSIISALFSVRVDGK